MTDRELIQMALNALELVTARMLDCRDELAERGGRPKTNLKHQDLWDLAFIAYTETAIPIAGDLRARLAQLEPEPVAWWHDRGDVVDLNVSGHGTPLYFAPPQREWVGLTDEEIRESLRWSYGNFARAIEAKLKEKNGA